MPTDDVQIKSIPAVRLAELTGVAAGFEPGSISPVIRPLYHELIERLTRNGITPVGPAIAYYEDAPDGGVLVHAGLPVDAEPTGSQDFSIVDLPPLRQAATIVHRGSMENVMASIQTLSRWIDSNGYASAGYNREFYLEIGDDEQGWVTELQEPITRR
jgi:effector-binding domain-containing protein